VPDQIDTRLPLVHLRAFVRLCGRSSSRPQECRPFA
jgi:hypothetical protein